MVMTDRAIDKPNSILASVLVAGLSISLVSTKNVIWHMTDTVACNDLTARLTLITSMDGYP